MLMYAMVGTKLKWVKLLGMQNGSTIAEYSLKPTLKDRVA